MSETHRPFGNTGLTIPRVVFGSTCLGNLFVQMSDSDKSDLVREWFRSMPAPVAIDSAGKYGAGLALEVIHRELTNLSIDPADVVISNKLAWRRIPLTTPEPTFEPGVWIGLEHDAVQEISYEGILRCYEDGRQMLGDYPQALVSVHDPDEYLAAATDADDRRRRLNDIVDAYRALTELRDDGKVSGVGVGAKDWRSIQELDGHCDFDWVMMANSFTIMNHPPELIQFVDSLASRNIALVNSALTHGGFLVGGKFLDYRAVDPKDRSDAERLKWREKFTQVCSQQGVTPYQVAVAFGASHPAVTSIALSTSRVDRVESMVKSTTAEIPADVWAALREAGLIAAAYQHVP